MPGTKNVIIAGTGHCVPTHCITNETIVSWMNTSVQFIEERTGVLTRYHVAADQGLKDLIVPAAAMALEKAQLEPGDVDMLIINTLSPDYHDPSEACLIQAALQLRQVPAFDIRAQCTGLLYGMEIARHMLAAGTYRHMLVVCGEVLSKRIDPSDDGRNLSILLGDGAGAVVLSAQDEGGKEGFLDLIIRADGQYYDLLWTQAPGSANHTFANDEASCPHFRMNGRPMFQHAAANLTQICQDILVANNLTLDDIDVVIPHQPNLRILDEVIERLSIPRDKMEINVDQLGNMASASLPVTLSSYRNGPRYRPGHLVLLVGYGSGATWGAALYQF